MLNIRTQNMITLVTAVALCSVAAQAQDFDLTWHTIDGGGVMFSTAGAFELSGTIGQPDAGKVAAGAYTLSGGFWPGAGGGGVCNTQEKITKAKCRTKGGKVKKVIVVVKKGTPKRDYTATLDTGEELIKSAKKSGKVKFTFKGNKAPECGPNGASVCDRQKAFNCNC